VFIREVSSADNDFVRKDTFDAHMYRIGRMEQDINELKQDVGVLKEDVSTIKGDIKTLNERLDHTVDTLTVAINAVDARVDGLEKHFDKRFDDMSQYQNKWFTLLGILVAVVPIAVALIQNAIAK